MEKRYYIAYGSNLNVRQMRMRCPSARIIGTSKLNDYELLFKGSKARLEQLRTTKAAREAQAEAIGAFMFEMQELDTLTEFDEKLWLTTIDTVTVHADGRMTFKFQGGTEIEG